MEIKVCDFKYQTNLHNDAWLWPEVCSTKLVTQDWTRAWNQIEKVHCTALANKSYESIRKKSSKTDQGFNFSVDPSNGLSIIK